MPKVSISNRHFGEAEKQIHIMYRLSRRSFKQIVYGRKDKQLISVFLEMQQTFIGIHHLFQIEIGIGYECKRMVIVILFIQSANLIELYGTFGILDTKIPQEQSPPRTGIKLRSVEKLCCNCERLCRISGRCWWVNGL